MYLLPVLVLSAASRVISTLGPSHPANCQSRGYNGYNGYIFGKCVPTASPVQGCGSPDSLFHAKISASSARLFWHLLCLAQLAWLRRAETSNVNIELHQSYLYGSIYTS